MSNEKEGRVPLLKDEDIYGQHDRFGRSIGEKQGMAADDVRDFYEAKITSGELRVVKKVVYPTKDEIADVLKDFYDTMNALGLKPLITSEPYEKKAAKEGDLYTISHGCPNDEERVSIQVDSSDAIETLKDITRDWKPSLDKTTTEEAPDPHV